MAVHAGARLLAAHHKNPLGFTVAAHSIGQYLLLGTATVDALASHHCVAWISNHASEHSHRNSAVQLGDEERTKLLLTEMCRYK